MADWRGRREGKGRKQYNKDTNQEVMAGAVTVCFGVTENASGGPILAYMAVCVFIQWVNNEWLSDYCFLYLFYMMQCWIQKNLTIFCLFCPLPLSIFLNSFLLRWFRFTLQQGKSHMSWCLLVNTVSSHYQHLVGQKQCHITCLQCSGLSKHFVASVWGNR